jgi:hypothetical protein
LPPHGFSSYSSSLKAVRRINGDHVIAPRMVARIEFVSRGPDAIEPLRLGTETEQPDAIVSLVLRLGTETEQPDAIVSLVLTQLQGRCRARRSV